MKKSLQVWFAACCALVLGCEKPPEKVEITRPVRVVRVQDPTAFTSGYLPGRAKATQEVSLAVRVAGPLIDLPVNVGDELKRGDVVARIDPRDFQVAYRGNQANLAAARAEIKAMQIGARPEEIEQLRAMVDQAEARLQTATNEFARAERLIASRTISQSEYDEILETKLLTEAQLRQAREELQIGERGARPEDIEAKQAEIRSLEADLSSAKNQLNDTILRAPFDGVVVAKYVENFEEVQAKQAIVRLLDASQIEMVVSVPESGISTVPYVVELVCTFDAFPELRLAAKVKEIGAEASQSTRTYPVTLIMEQPKDKRILPGMAGRVTGRVELPAEAAKEGVEIPESAVFVRGEKQCVWVVESADGKSGTVVLREVSRGELSARGLRHVQGVQAGEYIATAGVELLEEGQAVRILDATS